MRPAPNTLRHLAVAMASCAISASAALPVPPESTGLLPRTATGWINGTNGLNNFGSESLSVDIVNNGNVIVGWEDDGSDINSFLGVWTLLDSNGNMITPMTVQTNRDTNGDIDSLQITTNRYLSYFRSDNTPTPPFPGGWGPKVRANRFGNGMGMGSMPWAIGLEVPELFAINEDAGGLAAGGGVAGLASSDDFPCVQLLNNDGTPLRSGVINGINNLGIVTLADADVQPAGAIRIGGWDYLSSGNILIVGESRQADDRALTGQAAGRVPVFRIVTPGGTQVKAYTAVSETPDGGNISRNGAAVTANGFAIRWQRDGGGTTVRLFDNAGNPTSGNLDLATLTGHPEANSGGDGGGSGINGNGKDAYVLVGDYAGSTVWATVLNANGTVRWSRNVAEDKVLTGFNGTSAAIDEWGQVVVVFGASPDPGLRPAIMGRRFDPAGNAVGASFYVGETEIPDLAAPPTYASDSPKVSWRNGTIAVAWFSKNYADPSLNGTKVIATRLFLSGPPSLSVAKNGNSLRVFWPLAVTGYTLESSPSLAPGALWSPVAGVVNNSVTIANPSGTQFYRLKQ